MQIPEDIRQAVIEEFYTYRANSPFDRLVIGPYALPWFETMAETRTDDWLLMVIESLRGGGRVEFCIENA